MKLLVKDLYNINEGLSKLLDKDLPTSVAFSIQKNVKAIGDEITPANEVRTSLAEKYKEFTDDDGVFKEGNEVEKAEYAEKINELMEQEVDVKIRPLKLSELGETIKPRTLFLLDEIIEEDEE